MFASIEIILLSVIALFQCYSYWNNRRALLLVRSTFPTNTHYPYRLVSGLFLPKQTAVIDVDTIQHHLLANPEANLLAFFQSEDEFEPMPIEVKLVSNPYTHSIYCFIQREVNIYLVRNNRRSTDFKVIRDIVERHCEASSNIAESTLNMPLYLGLLGTIAGIVLGTFHISGVAAGDLSSVPLLLQTVGLAMLVSGLGLLLTMLNLSLQKQAVTSLEGGKNWFLTFIQSELLPVLSNDLERNLEVMQQSLGLFNDRFEQNLSRFSGAVETTGKSIELQWEILGRLENLKFNQLVKDTVAMFDDIAKSTSAFRSFRQYQETLAESLQGFQDSLRSFQDMLSRVDNLDWQMETIVSNIYIQNQNHERLIELLNDNFFEIEARKNALRNMMDSMEAFSREQYSSLSQQTERYNQELKSAADNHVVSVRDTYELLKTTLAEKAAEMQRLAERDMAQLEETLRSRQDQFAYLNRLPHIEKALSNLSSHQQMASLFGQLLSTMTALQLQKAARRKGSPSRWIGLRNIFTRNRNGQPLSNNEKEQ